MKTHRLLLAAVWLATLAAAYFLGGRGESSPSPALPMTVESGVPAAPRAERGAVERTAGETREENAKAKADLPAIIARARMEMLSGAGGMMNIRGMLRAIAPIADLDDAQMQEALVEVEHSVREPQVKMMFYSLLLGQWAETDGRAAMTYAQAKLDKNSMFDMGVTSSVLGTWAQRDPEAAWKWFGTEQNDGSDRTRMMALSAIFAGFAANNLESALARAGTLDEQSRAMALSGIASGQMDEASRRRLIDRTASLPPEQRAQLRQGVLGQWTMTDPDAAVAWIRTLPEDEQKSLRANAAQRIMNLKPALGAELMLEGADEKEKPQLYSNVAMQWASQDMRAAGEWLTRQPQGPELDLARGTYAASIEQRDPAAAMDWARSVQDEKQRVASVGSTYQSWHAKDPAAAAAALAAAGLSPDQMKQIRERSAPQTTNGTTNLRSYGN